MRTNIGDARLAQQERKCMRMRTNEGKDRLARYTADWR